MIRVAFVIEGASFQGSINYFRNLFSALALLPERRIEPLLFVGRRAPESLLRNFRHVEVVRTGVLDDGTSPARLRRKADRWSGRRDPVLGLLLRRHRVDVLSHFGPLWDRGITTLAWIPDFQHRHLPEFFGADERRLRDEDFGRIVRRCDRVLLSSEAAQRDLRAFAPEAVARSRVLRFVPEVDASAAAVPVATLGDRYRFDGPYFYMPNQFWIHKNHRIVVDALAELKTRGAVVPTVLMTGNTEDYRHPDHYAGLIARVRELGLEDAFRVLGTVPYGDLLSLMHHAVAVINPSLFEGWSSSVEEAKALGKTVLLSDLPVHREQNPARGVFFDPHDAGDLAAKMLRVLRTEGDAPASFVFSASYPEDRLKFASRYEEIVVEALDGSTKGDRR